MITCYGCGYPMHSPWSVYEVEETTVSYCVKCDLIRRLKDIDPGDHEIGTISNGTATMRTRERQI